MTSPFYHFQQMLIDRPARIRHACDGTNLAYEFLSGLMVGQNASLALERDARVPSIHCQMLGFCIARLAGGAVIFAECVNPADDCSGARFRLYIKSGYVYSDDAENRNDHAADEPNRHDD